MPLLSDVLMSADVVFLNVSVKVVYDRPTGIPKTRVSQIIKGQRRITDTAY